MCRTILFAAFVRVMVVMSLAYLLHSYIAMRDIAMESGAACSVRRVTLKLLLWAFNETAEYQKSETNGK